MKQFLRESKVKVTEWPPNSPDLNPIEHFWALIKLGLDQYKDSPNTMEELWGRVQTIWTSVPLEYLHDLYESMPRRMQGLNHPRDIIWIFEKKLKLGKY